MRIKRYDNIEFRVLLCADGGYYPDGTPEAERAKLLMKEGIFNSNPVELWSHSGYKGLTEIGKKYYDQFLKRVRKSHGHVWKLNNHDDPDDKSEYGKQVDLFAYSSGYHNGYECVKCGYTFCKHCETEFEVEVCSKKK